MELVAMEQAAEKAKELLTLFRDNKWPTYHIQHIASRPGATFFLPNTEGAEIHDAIKPLPRERILQKHFPNSFRETPLLQELREADVQKLVICGAMSHMCIDATTRAAADFGFECVVVHDACSTRDLQFAGDTIPAHEVHGAFMAALAAVYAKVTSVNEFRSTI